MLIFTCLLDQSIRQRRDAERPHPALRLRNIHPAHRLRDVRPRQQLGLDRRPVLLQMSLELGYPDAINTGHTLVADHPLVRKPQVAALTHGFHQPACPLQLRFRPLNVRRFHLDTQPSPLRIPSGLRCLRPIWPMGFCLHRLHRETFAYSRSSMFGPSPHPSSYYGLG